MHHFIRISTWVTICLLFVRCRSAHNEPQYPVGVLPQAPQYSDPSQWYITSRNAVADVFYITSTETGDYTLALIGKEGNYHSREIWLYRDCLRDNIARRTARYLSH